MLKSHRKILTLSKILLFTLTALLCLQGSAAAQNLLSKRVNVTADHRRLADVLDDIGKQAGFYFSYNGQLISKDSLVSLSVNEQLVSAILGMLFKNKYVYEQQKNYLIITAVLPHLQLINADVTNDNNSYSISGLIINEQTGERLMNVSVYEKEQLVSVLTDEHGYFKLRFKAANPGSVAVTVSKVLYKDTTIRFLQTVAVSSRYNNAIYQNLATKNNRIERTGLGRLFISTRQKIQSINIPDFFATRPFQVSLAPGLSTHGMFSPQVVNKFSVNLAGGYTAGVNGLEIGGLFNINKKDARYLQLAGVFNLVGGNVTGLQLAGVHNMALDTIKGVQIAGFINKSEDQVSGMQFSALHNDAHKLKGLQIGLVNEADTSYGASIGLVNIIRNGFYKVSLSANNLTNTNISLKTGTHNFYSSLLTGANLPAAKKMYTFGLGIGHDVMFSDRAYLSAEVNYRFANTGLWDDRWAQAGLLLNVQLSKHVSLLVGPTLNHYNHSGSYHLPGYENVTNIPDYPSPSAGHQTKNWIGWEAGLAFNSVFNKSAAKTSSNASSAWYLGLGATAGVGWDEPYKWVKGAEVFAHRDVGSRVTATFSAGYVNFSVKGSYTYSAWRSEEGSGYEYGSSFKILPVKAGIRTYLTSHLFFAGEVGAAFGINYPDHRTVISANGTSTTTNYGYRRSFIYSPSAGYTFKNGLELGVKFEDYMKFSDVKQFALRAAYRIKVY